MDFSRISLQNWQQFADIDIVFHDRATILTGANGSGKTTILSILARHQGWQQFSLATPKTDKRTNKLKYFSAMQFFELGSNADRTIGSITYTDGSGSKIQVPQVDYAQYQVEIPNQRGVRCFYIPSHRQTFSYRRVAQISTMRKDRAAAFSEIQQNHINRHAGNQMEPSSLIMKNTLLGWMINGYGVRSPTQVIMPPDEQQITNFEGFRDVLRKVLPKSLGFENIEVRDYEIVFSCNGGKDEFLLETASGGISALIDMAWQIYMFDTEGKAFAVVIDEVENHLHPSMQRTLLPNFINAFPHAKFIVSTHSPLIVTSVEDASVYALRYDEKNKIKSFALDFTSQVKNAIDILDEVLGVSTTLPDWAVERMTSILRRHEDSDPTPASLSLLRSELDMAGLGKLFPAAISRLAERHQ